MPGLTEAQKYVQSEKEGGQTLSSLPSVKPASLAVLFGEIYFKNTLMLSTPGALQTHSQSSASSLSALLTFSVIPLGL